VAASRDKRHQHEDSEMEQGQRDRLRFRRRRNQQKPLMGQEVSRKLPQPPDLLSQPIPVRRQIPRKPKPQAVSRILPQVQPLQPGSELNPQQPKLRTPRGNPFSPSVDAGHERTARAPIDAPAFQRTKQQVDTSNLRRGNKQLRMGGTIPVTPAPVGTGTRRVRQSPASVSPQSKKARSPRHSQKRPLSPFIHIIRLLILGIGIGAIVGTLLSALNPATQASDKVKETPKAEVQETPSDVNAGTPLALSQEIPELKAQMQTLAAEHPALQPGVFLVDLDTGAYLDWQSSATFASASTIKVPILVAFFQDVDDGKIRLDEPLTMQPEMIAAGSGDLQYKQAGTQYTALEVATKMITISDNTATNMIITRLGGAAALNARFRSWGLSATSINSPLPDVEGTNTTSPKDLGSLMSLVNQGKLVSLRSRDRLLDIMQRTQTNSLLPQGLGAGAIIAHKTGNIGSLLADVGLVDMPTGKRYLVAVMVKRPHNDATAEELIRQISRTVYDYFNQPRATPSTTLTPSEGTATISQALTSEDSVN